MWFFVLLSLWTCIGTARGYEENYLRIRLTLRNPNISSTEIPCNLLSIIVLTTGEEIFLKETSGQIYRETVNSTDWNDTCTYQDLYPNSTRMISLSTSYDRLSIFINLAGVNYVKDNASLPDALDFVDLWNYNASQSSNDQRQKYFCAVDKNYTSDAGHVVYGAGVDALVDAPSVDYVNNTITDYYVKWYLIADYILYIQKGTQTRSFVLQLVNFVNTLYRPLGIHVFLVGLEIWSAGNRMVVSRNATQTILNLMSYRTRLPQNFDAMHLLSGSMFDFYVVGGSVISAICNFPRQVGLVTDYYSTDMFQTGYQVAHELGHTLGLPHDTPGCSCFPDYECIMVPVFTPGFYKTRWSTCSLFMLAKNLQYIRAMRCLEDIPSAQTVNSVSTCGNGVVDVGEDCDPAALYLNSADCCNPTTCRFRPGALCSSGRCCDKTTCRPLPAGTMCRQASNECDLPEYCNGSTEQCPGDRVILDGSPCDNSTGYCYNGTCGSSDLQCRNIMGPGSSANRSCYYLMALPDLTGCKYTFFNQTDLTTFYLLSACNSTIGQENCGRQFCTSYTPNTFFPLKTNPSSPSCLYSLYDMSYTNYRDPTMVINGASCGIKKWCVDTICKDVPELPTKCSCSNSGVCNDLGHCHCKDGKSGDNCEILYGCGGSVDSGPTCPNGTAASPATTAPVIPSTSASRATTATVTPSTPGSSTTTAPLTPPIPESCSSNYCAHGGTCVTNINGCSCSAAEKYCCRCLGNYLPPNCKKVATKVVQMTLTSSTSFVQEYNDRKSKAFKEFEEKSCCLIRASLQRSIDISQMSCQCGRIDAGSSIGRMVLKGTDSFIISPSDVVSLIKNYCSNDPTICSGITPSLTLNPLDSCATATDCPSDTANCSPIDEINYTCSCKKMYYDETTSNDSTIVCTEYCSSQCNGNSECQEQRGTSVTCIPKTTTNVAIAVCLSVALLIIGILIAAVVVAYRRKPSSIKKDYPPEQPNNLYEDFGDCIYANDVEIRPSPLKPGLPNRNAPSPPIPGLPNKREPVVEYESPLENPYY